MTTPFDVIVLGAGAAGLMCAREAGLRGRRTVVLERNSKIGAKILISGGGRCNFTNTDARAEAYVSENPHFCKSALSRFTADDFLNLVKAHGIPFHEKKLGQLFCDRSARDIVHLLGTECERAGTRIMTGVSIEGVFKTDLGFAVTTSQGEFSSTSLVVATGGLSMSKVGASDLGYRIAEQFGHKIIATAPALDCFRADEGFLAAFRSLSGLSLDVTISCGGVSFRENILFTHFGLSGPAALQASLYWRKGGPVTIDLLPGRDAAEWLISKKNEGSRMELKNLLAVLFPKRFADAFCALCFPNIGTVPQTADKVLREAGRFLNCWEFRPVGTMGYDRAEVTRGGVATDDLSSKTMESRLVPGLYFIGEVVDVTGWLGGYNFQWAWSSGWAAGRCA